MHYYYMQTVLIFWFAVVPYRRVYISPAPPGPIFHGRQIHSWNSGGAKTRTALKTPRRGLSEDVPFGVDTLLVVEQWCVENRPGGM